MPGLTSLPPELCLLIASHLPASDLCSLRSSCSALRNICDLEAVWLSRCQQDFSLHISPDIPAKNLYQKLLFKYGPLLGAWQRHNLKFYGGLLRVYYEADTGGIIFENLLPAPDIYQDLRRQKFLTLSLTSDQSGVSVENHDLLTFRERAVVRLEEEEEMVVTVPSLTDYISSPAEWRELLETFREWDSSTNTETAIMKFVSVYHNRNIFLYSRVLTPAWCQHHHGAQASGSSILASLAPGVFKGHYGGHGVELVHLQDGQAVKITGDPNVPFNQVTVRVTSSQCLHLSEQQQLSVIQVREATEKAEDCHQVSNSEAGRSKFMVPEGMVERIPVTWKDCLGRWPAEVQIASQMFQDSQFILANFILFSPDEFAVMLLDLNTISLYHRAKEL